MYWMEDGGGGGGAGGTHVREDVAYARAISALSTLRTAPSNPLAKPPTFAFTTVVAASTTGAGGSGRSVAPSRSAPAAAGGAGDGTGRTNAARGSGGVAAASSSDGGGGAGGAAAVAVPSGPTCALDVVIQGAPESILDAALVFFAVFPFADGKGHDKTWISITADDAFRDAMGALISYATSTALPEDDPIGKRVRRFSGVGNAQIKRAREILSKCGSEGPTRRELTVLLAEIHNALGAEMYPPNVSYFGIPAVPEDAATSDFVQIPAPGGDSFDDTTAGRVRSIVERLTGGKPVVTAIDQLTGANKQIFAVLGGRDVIPSLMNGRTGGTVSDPGPTEPSRTAQEVSAFQTRVATEVLDRPITFQWPLGIPIAWKTTMALSRRAGSGGAAGGGAPGRYFTKKNLWLPGNSTGNPDVRIELVGEGVQINVVRAFHSAWAKMYKSRRVANGEYGAQIEGRTYTFRVEDGAGGTTVLEYGSEEDPSLRIVWNQSNENIRQYSVHPLLTILPLLKANGDQGIALGVSRQFAEGVRYLASIDPGRAAALLGAFAGREISADELAWFVVSGDIMSLLFSRACGKAIIGLGSTKETTIGYPMSRHVGERDLTPEVRSTRLTPAIQLVLNSILPPGTVTPAWLSDPNKYRNTEIEPARFAQVERRSNGSSIYTAINELANTLDTIRVIETTGEEGMLQLQLQLLSPSPRDSSKSRLTELIDFVKGRIRELNAAIEVPNVEDEEDEEDGGESAGDSGEAELSFGSGGSSYRPDEGDDGEAEVEPADEYTRLVKGTIRVYQDFLTGVLYRLYNECLIPPESLAAPIEREISDESGFLTSSPIEEDLKDAVRVLRRSARQLVTETDETTRILLNPTGQAIVTAVIDEAFPPPRVAEDDGRFAGQPVRTAVLRAFRKVATLSIRYNCSELLIHDTLYTVPTTFVDTAERYSLASVTYHLHEFLKSLIDNDAMRTYVAARESVSRLPESATGPDLYSRLYAFFRKDPFYYDDRTSDILAVLVYSLLTPFVRRVEPSPGTGGESYEISEEVALQSEGQMKDAEIAARAKYTAYEEFSKEIGIPITSLDISGNFTSDLTPEQTENRQQLAVRLGLGGGGGAAGGGVSNQTLIRRLFDENTEKRLVATLFDAGASEPDEAEAASGPLVVATTPPRPHQTTSSSFLGSPGGAGGLFSPPQGGTFTDSSFVETEAVSKKSEIASLRNYWMPVAEDGGGAAGDLGGVFDAGAEDEDGGAGGAGATLARYSPLTGSEDEGGDGAAALVPGRRGRKRPLPSPGSPERPPPVNVILDEIERYLTDMRKTPFTSTVVEYESGAAKRERFNNVVVKIKSYLQTLEELQGVPGLTMSQAARINSLAGGLQELLKKTGGGRRRGTYRKHRKTGHRLTYKRRHI